MNAKGLKLIAEVLIVSQLPANPNEAPKSQSVGWTVLEIFNEEGELCSGIWRIPIYVPVVDPSMTPHIIENTHTRKK